LREQQQNSICLLPELLNWGTRLALFIYTVYLYIYTASEAKELGMQKPFTCWGQTENAIRSSSSSAEGDCPTEFYMMFNFGHAIGIYILLGFLELSIVSAWFGRMD
jgi:hypothetical protein